MRQWFSLCRLDWEGKAFPCGRALGLGRPLLAGSAPQRPREEESGGGPLMTQERLSQRLLLGMSQ